VSEPYRPHLHFSPRAGWMNDPNGMIRVDGVWHLFFQHDPDSTSHGPMHWGHATSTDLAHWTEQPLALRPTALGTCFSGSAIQTEAGAVKLFYTAHSRTPAGADYQVQCMVHADAGLSRFEPDPANPVVPNPGLVAFRDPKVIWHEPGRRWIMLVTQGQSVGFYGSSDLRQWTYLSSFGEEHGRHSPGPWECPDLFPLATPGGETVWVLVVGLNPGGYAPGSGTQYFLGQFDGTAFVNANAPETELWLDYGRDYYAAQSFFERGGTTRPIAIAWASNWLYARQTPTRAFRGVMSLPRELRLIETPKGLRLAAQVPLAVQQAMDGARLPGTRRHDIPVHLEVGETLAISLFGEAEPHFVVARTSPVSARIRTVRAAVAGMEGFAHDYVVELDWPANGSADLSLFIDRGLVELCAADGAVWITNLYFPDDPEAATAIRHPDGTQLQLPR
jgi:fructan beta-fructosidase